MANEARFCFFRHDYYVRHTFFISFGHISGAKHEHSINVFQFAWNLFIILLFVPFCLAFSRPLFGLRNEQRNTSKHNTPFFLGEKLQSPPTPCFKERAQPLLHTYNCAFTNAILSIYIPHKVRDNDRSVSVRWSIAGTPYDEWWLDTAAVISDMSWSFLLSAHNN